VQFIYWLLVYSRFIFYKPVAGFHRRLPVSVIICAKDERENLSKNLPLILEQAYPDFEVIVVNDCSTDDTADILLSYQSRYPHLRTSTIRQSVDFTRGKKLALTIGIKAARNEWLLLTDADCRPESDQWINHMQKNFDSRAEVVLGYGGYIREKSLLNLVIRADTLFIAIQYFSFALTGFPYMGVGRNLAYRKSVFFKNRGFATHSRMISGDDDLFVNEVARSGNTRIEYRKESHTRSEAEKTWRDWYLQKKRHLLTGPRYRPSTKWLLGTELISRYLFYLTFTCLLILSCLPVWILGIMGARLLAQLLVFKCASRHLNEKYLLLLSLFLDMIIPVLNAWIVFSNYVVHKRSRWK
jgi:glycosyltransferase involved in cell wall biosynthesis